MSYLHIEISDPFSKEGWKGFGTIPPAETPCGFTLPEHKGERSRIIFDSSQDENESVIYIARPDSRKINQIAEGIVVEDGTIECVEVLSEGKSYLFAKEYIVDNVGGFEKYPEVFRVTQK